MFTMDTFSILCCNTTTV